MGEWVDESILPPPWGSCAMGTSLTVWDGSTEHKFTPVLQTQHRQGSYGGCTQHCVCPPSMAGSPQG